MLNIAVITFGNSVYTASIGCSLNRPAKDARFNGGIALTDRQIAPSDKAPLRLFEEFCAQGTSLLLRPQQRIPLSLDDKMFVLKEGMIAIDAMPAKGKLQVLDFLIAHDAFSSSAIFSTSKVSLRAITGTALVAIEPPEYYHAVPTSDYWAFLIEHCVRQLERVNLHQLMIGRLETEARVASFVLALAMRSVRGRSLQGAPQMTVALPMSRVDIANYLVINCDTLSRTMMRFCDSGLIERVGRHVIRITNFDGLKQKSPISPLLSDIFLKKTGEDAIRLQPSAGNNTPQRPAYEQRSRGLPDPEKHPASLSIAGQRNASRGVL